MFATCNASRGCPHELFLCVRVALPNRAYQTENDLVALEFPCLYILRPALLLTGKRRDSRCCEACCQCCFPIMCSWWWCCCPSSKSISVRDVGSGEWCPAKEPFTAPPQASPTTLLPSTDLFVLRVPISRPFPQKSTHSWGAVVCAWQG